ncbi:CPBP family intramembrane metalloprotease [Bacillus thuringiensis serovar roskildiensis]|uniref:CPBP family intramembrane metalloprotease n=2 Tax=Bacillus thuringiensis TaxID=1428 RepID=A0A9Q5SNS3_BACTU|nr:CPBP family intramembrane glutamic endopeptidase [Bacillus thuringiensis]OTW71929.1 CPBP family intramembrane metalloprotease [Bacillus thuringiensis serovar coreanensis]OTX55549.1 CPBP family intramembrane metalloprotease [Bacillus thuringiensis serovar sooncheon]OTX58886.1 CPBP family intramembrane metalloprotease [Bacillus thuringiensis serovar guiyangiensis]OTX72481.1 CPBP family intramembrane metalloprotease [Bacillus thuringiensis serovar roskildiensis]
MNNMNRNIIYHSTLCIYLLTSLIYIILLNIENGRNYLGFTMVIPLLAAILYQKLYNKQKIVHTFGISRPKIRTLIFSILFPILLGLCLHFYFYIYNIKFLFNHYNELRFLLLIGLTIAALSAFLEEIIWRGNFHYHLRKKYSLKQTAIITASLWSIWHLPVSIFYKNYELWFVGILSYLSLLFIVSIILTYTREYSHSVITPAILHGMFNVFYLTDGVETKWDISLMELIKFILLVIVFGMMYLIHRKVKRT